LSALWTFPSILTAAFLVAWGAEATQFLISQGLALALLAWLQTLPEFAVEAVIAWDAGRDPARAQLAVANLTGAIRLLLGLGWPMVYFVYAAARRTAGAPRSAIRLEREHSVELMSLLPPLLFFGVILVKGSFTWVDALVLVALYLGYLWLLVRQHPRAVEDLAAAAPVSRWAYGQPGWRRPAAVVALFAAGGILLAVTVHPFLESMLALAGALGASQFVLVQWVAPLLSEFPEKVSAFYWARRGTHAPLALMNLVSSNLNQWTVLAAMIPLVYGYSSLRHHGTWQAFHFDAAQRFEIVLALLQTGLGVMLLATMEFGGRAASVLLLLWFAQFLRPSLRDAVAVAYGSWMALLALQFVSGRRVLHAPREFWQVVRKRDRPAPL
jgi:cation:H+ antiporter